MGSLWKDLALRWLGGDASAALAGDSRLLDLLTPNTPVPGGDAFRVVRQPGVYNDATALAAGDESPKEPADKRVVIEPS